MSGIKKNIYKILVYLFGGLILASYICFINLIIIVTVYNIQLL